jgi:tetratricopeptide (TPR) repeat protein
MGESFSVRVKNAFIGSNVGGGCMPRASTPMVSTSNNHDGDDDLYSIIADVPFFPPPHEKKIDNPPRQKQQQKLFHREEELVVDFPSRQGDIQSSSATIYEKHQLLSVQTNSVTTIHQTDHNMQNHPSQHSPKHNSLEEQQSQTFPGFALYTMARVYYVLGQYTRALDTTTECLAFQKKALFINTNNQSSDHSSISNTSGHSPSAGLGGGVRNLLKGGNVATNVPPSDPSPLVPNAHHPIVIANSTAKMLQHYPTDACVAQTLLLRARVLAVCGLYGCIDMDSDDNHSPSSGDITLVHQAIQHVEMALAIQRKISTFTHVNIDSTQWELAVPMILLGVLKVEIHCFEEAENAYEEALLILRSVRQLHEAEHSAAMERDNATMSKKHLKISKRITKEMAKVLYLKGRSFQCRRLYSDAFECYHKSLELFKTVGVSRYSAGTRRIIRCMTKSSALEKLLSEYLDDTHRI